MGNLFSSFDPSVSIMGTLLPMNWAAALIPVVLLPQVYWMVGSQVSKTFGMLMSYLETELSAVFGPLAMPGTFPVFISIFMFVIFSNFMGLCPYVFTSSSHLSMTLALGLPLWLGSMLWSTVFQFNSLMAHLVPSGTPGPLMPLMVVIESVSNIIRPGTLSIRLAANMVAGHLLLTLLGSQGPALSSFLLMFLMLALILLLMLEVGVACIQAYVFTVLSSLYLNELSSPAFNKTMV
uniref:ATP synthase subunit a n=1 Tax=Eucalanus bungii TaxID=121138 RepID=Q6L9V9_9MAXI|nr:ATPase subunits 6 [Eucalanus bungii]